jgi:hypothetical protein
VAVVSIGTLAWPWFRSESFGGDISACPYVPGVGCIHNGIHALCCNVPQSQREQRLLPGETNWMMYDSVISLERPAGQDLVSKWTYILLLLFSLIYPSPLPPAWRKSRTRPSTAPPTLPRSSRVISLRSSFEGLRPELESDPGALESDCKH